MQGLELIYSIAIFVVPIILIIVLLWQVSTITGTSNRTTKMIAQLERKPYYLPPFEFGPPPRKEPKKEKPAEIPAEAEEPVVDDLVDEIEGASVPAATTAASETHMHPSSVPGTEADAGAFKTGIVEMPDLSPGEINEILEDSEEHLEREEYDIAEESYRRLLENDPENQKAWAGLAESLRQQKKYPEALAAFKKAIELDPKDTRTAILCAEMLKVMSQIDEAVAILVASSEANPEDFEVLLALGLLYLDQSKCEEAGDAIMKAMDIAIDNESVRQAYQKWRGVCG